MGGHVSTNGLQLRSFTGSRGENIRYHASVIAQEISLRSLFWSGLRSPSEGEPEHRHDTDSAIAGVIAQAMSLSPPQAPPFDVTSATPSGPLSRSSSVSSISLLTLDFEPETDVVRTAMNTQLWSVTR